MWNQKILNFIARIVCYYVPEKLLFFRKANPLCKFLRALLVFYYKNDTCNEMRNFFGINHNTKQLFGGRRIK